MAATNGRPRASEPTAVDIHVGARIKIRRQVLGTPPEDLARMLQMTVDELLLIETGQLRIGAERIYIVSQHLDAPVSWFFSGLDPDLSASAAVQVSVARYQEGADLLAFYYAQSTPATRQKLVELARILQDSDVSLPDTSK